MSLFSSIKKKKKNTSRPIRFCRSLTISMDLLHFLSQTENSREQHSFPLGPTSFRATYLPVSECQTVSVYKTQAIYFLQIRVCLSSQFTHCLFFCCWSFVFFTYTDPLLSDAAICILVKVRTGTHTVYWPCKNKLWPHFSVLVSWTLTIYYKNWQCASTSCTKLKPIYRRYERCRVLVTSFGAIVIGDGTHVLSFDP